jgi:Cys-tRNA(Pro)/Cys-tRNA(Cys) deacylase
MESAMRKTNAMRVLEARHIPYRAHAFSSDAHSAQGAADALDVHPSRVYKTLVVVREQGRPLLVMVAGNKELDLRALAAQLGEKKLRMASQKEAERLTGLQVGGISALALLNKGFSIYADQDILSLPRVYISGGRRGLDLSLNPHDLLQVTSAQTVACDANPLGR